MNRGSLGVLRVLVMLLLSGALLCVCATFAFAEEVGMGSLQCTFVFALGLPKLGPFLFELCALLVRGCSCLFCSGTALLLVGQFCVGFFQRCSRLFTRGASRVLLLFHFSSSVCPVEAHLLLCSLRNPGCLALSLLFFQLQAGKLVRQVVPICS